MEERTRRRHPFETDRGERNIYTVLLIALAPVCIGIYDSIAAYLRFGNEALQWVSLWSSVMILLSLFGIYALYQQRAGGWIITAGVFTFSILRNLISIVMTGLTMAGFEVYATLPFASLQTRLITNSLYLLIKGTGLYLLLQSDTLELMHLSRGTRNPAFMLGGGLITSFTIITFLSVYVA